LDKLLSNIYTVNSQLEIIMSSTKTGEGIAAWVDWIISV